MGLNGNDQTQSVNSDQGIRTQYGIILPPGARVAAYVRSTGIQSGDDAFLAQNLVTTLAAGLARVRPGLGDFVVCLPGHVESVVDATTFSAALVAGTKIVGVGRGGNTPTFNFTLAGSSWVVNKADVFIGGLRINAAFATNPTTLISVTGADFGFSFNEVICSQAAVGGAGTVINAGAGSDRADISGNIFRGAPGVGTTDFTVTAAVADIRFCDNESIHAPSATNNGLVIISQATTGIKILRNTLYATLAGSTTCVSFAANASDGVVANNTLGVKNNGTAAAQGITLGAGCLVVAFQNFCSDEPQKSGVLAPIAAT